MVFSFKKKKAKASAATSASASASEPQSLIATSNLSKSNLSNPPMMATPTTNTSTTKPKTLKSKSTSADTTISGKTTTTASESVSIPPSIVLTESTSSSSSGSNTSSDEASITISGTSVLVDNVVSSSASSSSSSASTSSAEYKPSTTTHAKTTSSTLTTSSTSSTSPIKTADPYADVRDRMEALSLHSRMVNAFHTASEDEAGLNILTETEPVITFFAAWTTYLGYAVLIFVGHIRELCSKIFQRGRYRRSTCKGSGTSTGNGTGNRMVCPSDDDTKYSTLLKSFENFYTKRLYHRIQDCFNRPLASNPGANVQMLERISTDGNKTMQVLGKITNLTTHDDAHLYQKGQHFNTVSEGRVTRQCLNLGSYNYLGFADDWQTSCREGVMSSLEDLPLSLASSRMEGGTSKLHAQVEEIVAEFVGKPEAMVLNMGFNTNATTIPALTGRGDLIVSDELNHTSIVNGARKSGAAIRCFRHNDTKHLEEILKEAIVLGQPRTRRPWKKIMVIVEGIYSMEGEYCDLRNVVDVCKQYGAYVYLDEAHSIGAMGETGRGCCEYTGVDPKDVDILMGTFTKSFGGMGGYIAGEKEVIDQLRESCAASAYHNSLSPVVCQQVITSFQVIMGQDGTDTGKKKIAALRDNSNYFRMRLTDMGLHVLGHYDSPIMPVMLYNPTKIAAFSRECLKRGLAVVVVGFPAVPIVASRARFCISAGHTRKDLDRALDEIDEIADILKLRYARSTFG